jgi:hypothetical protein
LRPLIIELNALKSQGLDLIVAGNAIRVKVVVGVLTGYNLFLNGITGFVESLVAHKPCRQCTVERNDFQRVLVEDKTFLRTVEPYDHATENISVPDTGIKQKCVLNELKYFHSVNNCSQDVMHDVFEGVLVYDRLLVSSGLVQNG